MATLKAQNIELDFLSDALKQIKREDIPEEIYEKNEELYSKYLKN
jgi:hypothetical protein